MCSKSPRCWKNKSQITKSQIPEKSRISKSQIPKKRGGSVVAPPPSRKENHMDNKPENLEERAAVFAADARTFVRTLPRTLSNIEDAKQLVRASGSVAANCIEANEALGQKDRVMRFKICRKEARESALWLRLVHTAGDGALDRRRETLLNEARELRLILSAIIKKLE
jgi:four helix bundle protein